MTFRKANLSDIQEIWSIIHHAIVSRRNDGSSQWQDGYPNKETISSDIVNDYGYVWVDQNQVKAYVAIQSAPEPTYKVIEGEWLTQESYVVLHRIASAPSEKGKGLATSIMMEAEKLAIKQDISSIRIDTHEDNAPMRHIINKLDYAYCGKIYVRNEPRLAYEKILAKT